MDEQTFNNQEINDYYHQENFNRMNLDYFTSQVFGDAQSEITDSSISVTSSMSSSTSNPLWQHFNRNPSDARGYNVCKNCSIRYKLTTGTTTLRKHLKDQHQIDIPVRSVKKQRTITEIEPFDEQKQMEHTKYLVQWLICDLQPFTTVDNTYFRAFVSHFCPCYTMPERHQVKDLIIGGFNS